MTRLALGAKWGRLGSPPVASGAAAAARASRSWRNSVASAAVPSPVLVRFRNRRRESSVCMSVCGFIGQSFVMVRSRFRIMLATIW